MEVDSPILTQWRLFSVIFLFSNQPPIFPPNLHLMVGVLSGTGWYGAQEQEGEGE